MKLRFLVACLAAIGFSACAQTPGVVPVTAILGEAFYTEDGEHWTALSVGHRVGLGAVVHAGPSSAVDLFLGPDAGYLRLAENTQVTLESYSVNESYQQADLGLMLRQGVVVGISNHVAQATDYKIKMSHGVVGVTASQFRVDARGFFVCLDGAMVYAHPAEDGTVKSEVLEAPPARYFTRGAGVQTAPQVLIQEVLAQSTGPLPKSSAVKEAASAVVAGQGAESRPSVGLSDPSGFGTSLSDPRRIGP